MAPSPAPPLDLPAIARRVRHHIIDIVAHSGSGHLGAALSQADIVVALYCHAMRFDPQRPDWPERDRFILSKGHGGLGLVALFAELGTIPTAELAHFGQF